MRIYKTENIISAAYILSHKDNIIIFKLISLEGPKKKNYQAIVYMQLPTL